MNMAILTRLEALKDLVQEAIDKGATTVEQIHQTIAAMPLEALEKRGLLDAEAASLKEKQASTIGAVYDAIRRVNKEVGDLASGLIESLEDHVDAQKNIGRKD
jgi:predicted  nucleic acid-binding Zn-ribbon protein